MNWKYKNKEIEGVSDFPKETYGFVYIITHIPSDRSYIGKKILFNTRKVKLTKKELAEYEGVVGRRPSYKLAVKESNWQTYWGSNKELTGLLETEPPENFRRHILEVAPSKKLLTYYEVKYQMIYQVLEKPEEFFNDNVLGKFYRKDFN